MTTTQTARDEAGSEIDAAVARWAAAAGVPTSVAHGYESRTSTSTRVLRGMLLGGVVAVPVLLLGTLDDAADGLWLVLALVVIGLRIARQRQRQRQQRRLYR